jgi:hypothetical protein
MKDYRSHLETLRKQAAESALISSLTTVQQKRELLAKHAAHLNALQLRLSAQWPRQIRKRRRPTPKRLGSTELIQHATERRVLPVLHLDPAIGPAIRP